VRIRDTFTPDPHKAALYAELYQDFLVLRDAMSETWPRLAAMRGRSPEDTSMNTGPVIIPDHMPERSGDLTLPGTTPEQVRLLEEGKS
jgi:hypothetical protein